MQPAATPIAPVNPGASSNAARDAASRADAAPEAEQESFSTVLESRVVAQDAAAAPAAEATPATTEEIADSPADIGTDAASLLAALGLGSLAAALTVPADTGAAQQADAALASLQSTGRLVGRGAVDLVPAGPTEQAGDQPVQGAVDDAGAGNGQPAILAAGGKPSPLTEAEPETLQAVSARRGGTAQAREQALPAATPAASDALAAGAAGLTAAAGANVPAHRGPEAASISIPARLGSPEWDGQFAQRVAFLAQDRVQTAEVRINPPELGPVEIKLTLSDSQATLVFASQHAPVREAIESALPRLRELLAGAGITLGQATVGDQHLGREAQGQTGREAPGAGGRSAYGSAEELPPAAAAVRSYRIGMLDTFA